MKIEMPEMNQDIIALRFESDMGEFIVRLTKEAVGRIEELVKYARENAWKEVK